MPVKLLKEEKNFIEKEKKLGEVIKIISRGVEISGKVGAILKTKLQFIKKKKSGFNILVKVNKILTEETL